MSMIHVSDWARFLGIAKRLRFLCLLFCRYSCSGDDVAGLFLRITHHPDNKNNMLRMPKTEISTMYIG